MGHDINIAYGTRVRTIVSGLEFYGFMIGQTATDVFVRVNGTECRYPRADVSWLEPAPLVCGTCGSEAQVLHAGGKCAPCVRAEAATERQTTRTTTPCDECGAAYATRSPNTRKNEFLCTRCLNLRGESFLPLDAIITRAQRPQRPAPLKCEMRTTASRECRGKVRMRTGATLCDRHAGASV